MLLDEIVELKREEIFAAAESQEVDQEDDDPFDPHKELELFVRAWEKEFDAVNGDIEDNSDFDSDNDINPLDTMDDLGRYYNSKRQTQQMTNENALKRKQIQLSIVGKPNTGKSTLVNSLLKESRVIANDLAGTTRDAVRVQWIHAGRRITLVDTAGVKVKKGTMDVIDELVQK